jgi:probable HAF family extracellular repeat protein
MDLAADQRQPRCSIGDAELVALATMAGNPFQVRHRLMSATGQDWQADNIHAWCSVLNMRKGRPFRPAWLQDTMRLDMQVFPLPTSDEKRLEGSLAFSAEPGSRERGPARHKPLGPSLAVPACTLDKRISPLGQGLVVLVFLLGLSFSTFAQTYRLFNLGTLAGGESRPTAINSFGKVALFNAIGGDYRAFLQDGTRQDLGTLGGAQSYASGLNDADRVVGYAETSAGVEHAFLWTPGGTGGVPGNPEMMDLGTFGGLASKAFAINAVGHITGFAEAGANPHAFLFADGSMTDIGSLTELPNSFGYDINDSGHVAGTAYDKNYKRAVAFLCRDNSCIDLGTLGGRGASALALNNHDEVVGYSELPGGTELAFLYTDGQIHDLGTLGGEWSYAQAINNDGAVVGGSFVDEANTIYHAFISDQGAMVDLNAELDGSGDGWELIEAYGINDSGQIVGLGVFQNYDHVFRLTPLTQLPPEIAKQPADLAIECQSDASFEVIALGDSLTYQWFRGVPPDGSPLMDASAARLALTSTTPKDAGLYYVEIANAYGATTSSVCVLEILDFAPPLITGCPPDLTVHVEAGALGATVSWSLPEATDACSGSIPVDCQPASGSWFPLGATTVNCVASDLNGNTSSCSFTVAVREIPSPPAITQFSRDAGMLILGFATSEGSDYLIESTTDLASERWEPVTNAVPGTGQTVVVTLPWAQEQVQRFYRVSVSWL